MRGDNSGEGTGDGKKSAQLLLPFISFCVRATQKEGLFFPVFASPCKRQSCWVNAELSQALCEHRRGTSPVEGRNSWQVGCWQLKAAWDSAVEMPTARILLFILKHPLGVFPALDGMPRPGHPRASPLCTGPPCKAGPRHVGPAEPAVATSVCHSLPVPPELINKTSGVILAPGTGPSPGAQSCSFSVSPRRWSSLLFPSGEQDVD